jgi:hypothetical protein
MMSDLRDEEGHGDGDDCAKYLPEYRLATTDDIGISAEDLSEGDIYRDSALDAEGEWWRAGEVVALYDGEEIHVMAGRADPDELPKAPRH